MTTVHNNDNVFATCCILHNICLEADGFLDIDLPDVPFGLRSKLKFDPRGDGMWIASTSSGRQHLQRRRGTNDDDLYEEEQALDLGRLLTNLSWCSELWQQQMDALNRHYANQPQKEYYY